MTHLRVNMNGSPQLPSNHFEVWLKGNNTTHGLLTSQKWVGGWMDEICFSKTLVKRLLRAVKKLATHAALKTLNFLLTGVQKMAI